MAAELYDLSDCDLDELQAYSAEKFAALLNHLGGTSSDTEVAKALEAFSTAHATATAESSVDVIAKLPYSRLSSLCSHRDFASDVTVVVEALQVFCDGRVTTQGLLIVKAASAAIQRSVCDALKGFESRYRNTKKFESSQTGQSASVLCLGVCLLLLASTQ